MKTFQCGNCDFPLFFENTVCENCGHLCGYLEEGRLMLTFDPSSSNLIPDRKNKAFKYCKNKAYNVCNWVLEKHDTSDYCKACKLNRTIPNLSDEENFKKWKELEVAKHRLIYQLQKIGLVLKSKTHHDDGLAFDFIEKEENSAIMTGHANGIITILLREADPVHREYMKKKLLEPYRTLIGHLRHETGHYFWEKIISKHKDNLKDFREIFGDERLNYTEALQTYYKEGPSPNWQTSFISKYATSHPWEDWAETWAHYLHIMDMVETAHFFGLNIKQRQNSKAQKNDKTFDPYTVNDFETIIQTGIPLSFAVNSFNRAMGMNDVYPFIINKGVIKKMNYIHNLLLPKR